jgi:hypothetical protein
MNHALPCGIKFLRFDDNLRNTALGSPKKKKKGETSCTSLEIREKLRTKKRNGTSGSKIPSLEN